MTGFIDREFADVRRQVSCLLYWKDVLMCVKGFIGNGIRLRI